MIQISLRLGSWSAATTGEIIVDFSVSGLHQVNTKLFHTQRTFHSLSFFPAEQLSCTNIISLANQELEISLGDPHTSNNMPPMKT